MATVIAAFIAAAVATFGYLINARAKALEDRRKIYASALAAVSAYRELPHRVRRRADNLPQTRGALGTFICDVQCDLDRHAHLLELESVSVGYAYRLWVKKVHDLGGDARQAAWLCAPAESDDDTDYPERYDINDRGAYQSCLQAMRRNLRLIPLSPEENPVVRFLSKSRFRRFHFTRNRPGTARR